jgi:hypothetical protein
MSTNRVSPNYNQTSRLVDVMTTLMCSQHKWRKSLYEVMNFVMKFYEMNKKNFMKFHDFFFMRKNPSNVYEISWKFMKFHENVHEISSTRVSWNFMKKNHFITSWNLMTIGFDREDHTRAEGSLGVITRATLPTDGDRKIGLIKLLVFNLPIRPRVNL